MGSFVHSDDFSENVPKFMCNMAEYFVGFRPADSSNLYNRFLSRISDPLSLSYSTLNYDILFEFAADMNDLTVTHFENIDGKLFFLKLHGSCNYLPNVRNWTMTNVSFRGYGSFISLPLKAANVDETLNFCNSSLMSPAMSIYTTDKIAQFGDGQIRKTQETWKDLVMNADRILSIGVRPWMEDKHIWEPLSLTTAKLGYVGGKTEFYRWIESDRNDRETDYIGDTWSGCFEKTIQFMNY
jgi:hypothetical protein